MPHAGFSTGALALGDFRSALRCLRDSSADAVELSALRMGEIAPLVEALRTLDLRQYRYVSLHAPSKFTAVQEPGVVALLKVAAALGYYIVVHPDTIHDVPSWRTLGRWLCVENMDKRKSGGRTASELATFFERLPEANLCFDIAHARQYDSSMTEAYRILRAFGKRIRQVHVSEVTTSSVHVPMSAAAVADFRQVAALIPHDAAIIVESPVHPEAAAIEAELIRSRTMFSGEGSPDGTRAPMHYWW